MGSERQLWLIVWFAAYIYCCCTFCHPLLFDSEARLSKLARRGGMEHVSIIELIMVGGKACLSLIRFLCLYCVVGCIFLAVDARCDTHLLFSCWIVCPWLHVEINIGHCPIFATGSMCFIVVCRDVLQQILLAEDILEK